DLPAVYDVCFFFQAEDGIRDFHVTGVQTCALPISFKTRSCGVPCPVDKSQPRSGTRTNCAITAKPAMTASPIALPPSKTYFRMRSEERRVGKEGRSRWSPKA